MYNVFQLFIEYIQYIGSKYTSPWVLQLPVRCCGSSLRTTPPWLFTTYQVPDMFFFQTTKTNLNEVIEAEVVWKRVFLKIARFLLEIMNIEIVKSLNMI